MDKSAKNLDITKILLKLTFLPIANRSTALSYCPFSKKKSPHLCRSSGSALSSSSPEISCSAPNCLALNERSKALEKLPAYKYTYRQ